MGRDPGPDLIPGDWLPARRASPPSSIRATALARWHIELFQSYAGVSSGHPGGFPGLSACCPTAERLARFTVSSSRPNCVPLGDRERAPMIAPASRPAGTKRHGRAVEHWTMPLPCPSTPHRLDRSRQASAPHPRKDAISRPFMFLVLRHSFLLFAPKRLVMPE